jgi:ectoine hydroxylase-related dioxygenase (phytanoyl-CoA dioxygenase family)
MLDDATLRLHRYSIAASGWTRIPAQVDDARIARLRDACDRSTAAVQRHLAAGGELAHTFHHPGRYLGARALYCWDEACLELVQHPTIAALAALVLGEHRLWDLGTLCALPTADERQAVHWHRDFAIQDAPFYLWCFLCLDDVVPENGCTWAVPGSHRRLEAGMESWDPHLPPARFPTAIPLTARAGDIIALDPTLIHAAGRNGTRAARRMMNIGMCRADRAPRLDHWAISGPTIQRRASPQLRQLLDAERTDLDQTWSVLPESWTTAPRQLITMAAT